MKSPQNHFCPLWSLSNFTLPNISKCSQTLWTCSNVLIIHLDQVAQVGEFISFLEHLQTAVKHSIKAKTKHSKVFVKPHFSMIYWLKCCGMKIRVWQTYPPYKNLVPEIPRLGAERSMETWIRGSLHVLILLLLQCSAQLSLKYLMVWLRVWHSSWSRLLMGSLQ